MTAIQLRAVPTANIRANARNVRKDLGNIDELAASLRTNGMQQPIIVTPNPGGDTFSIVDGHRRHAAAVKAGMPQVPALVTTVTGKRQTLAMMLAAAMHKQLKPIEQARAFRDLQDDGMTTAEIAHTTGYTRATVLTRLSLLDLPKDAQDMVARDELTLGQAVELAKQVKASRTGTVAKKGSRSAWFTKSHRLAATVEAGCTHDVATRVHVGAVGCGQCWEDAIRADERGQLEVIPTFDEVAVLRAVDGRGGGSVMARADRLEALRRLHARGLSDSQIADLLKSTARQVLRDRQALDLPSNFPEFSPLTQPERNTA